MSGDPWFRPLDESSLARRRPNFNQLLVRAAVLLGLSASALFFIAPLYWLFSTAFKPPGSLGFPPAIVPTTLSLANLVAVATETRFVTTYFVNSLVVSIATVAFAVSIATLAGYALSRYSLPYERGLMIALLGVQMIPILAMVVPLYRLYSLFGLLDTLGVVVLTDTVLIVPVATWLVKGYFDTIPPGLEEAARVGGASRFQAFRVLVPVAKPAIGAAAIYAFVISWNQFVIPLTFTSSQAVATFPVGLFEFISRRGVVNWGLLGAASLVAMLPVLVLFAVFQRQFIAGLMGSGLKGK